MDELTETEIKNDFNTLDHNEWLEHNNKCADLRASTAMLGEGKLIVRTPANTGGIINLFKGLISTVVFHDGDEMLAVKSKILSGIEELYEYDFSDCYLYNLHHILMIAYDVDHEELLGMPTGTIDFSQFDMTTTESFSIRFAGDERKIDV